MSFGTFFDDVKVGEVYRHWPGKTISESEHQTFCLLTMVRHPIHLDAHHAKSATRLGQPLVIGSYVFSLLIGLSESDITGKALGHTGFDRVQHQAPVLHGDTIYGESEILNKENLVAKADRGKVSVETRAVNQNGVLVMSFRRNMILATREYRGKKIGPIG
ncbi:dehydratase [Amycolatopsis antarctica]|uniref:Dehydratase n=1 Tax=Amycolatopsis antarctica TaxID=1854586 RepID=A0A263D125_9PSEU|nr:MaoC family dehydratase [Amycolatopsis antarctica]OZM72140.1 dehydratase [Amycolatopsis antarctica]